MAQRELGWRISVLFLVACLGTTFLSADDSDSDEDDRRKREQRDGEIAKVIPRKGPGEIWVGSPEVFTRERLVNDQLKQDAWLRGKLEEEKDESFGVEGIVDMRSVVAFSSQIGIEADPNVISLYEAQSDAALADLRREQEARALDHEIERLKKIEEIRLRRRALAAGSAEAKDEDEGDESGDSGDASGGDSGDGGDDDDGNGGSADTAGETKALGARPTQPATGLTLETGLASRLGSQERKDLIPSPKDPVKSAADTSPLDEFRDRLAYREEIRNEIFENALDDRHDLRGNTAYRLNFDATILPKKKTEGWAVVEVRIAESERSRGAAMAALSRQRCFDLLDSFGMSTLQVPEKSELKALLPACDSSTDLAKLKLFWTAVDRAETDEARAEAFDAFRAELAETTFDDGFRSLPSLPTWPNVEAIVMAPCYERTRATLQACTTAAIGSGPDILPPGETLEELYVRWLRDFEHQANQLLAQRWAKAAACLLDADGRLKEKVEDAQCPGDEQLGHEIAMYAQRLLYTRVFPPPTKTGADTIELAAWTPPPVTEEEIQTLVRAIGEAGSPNGREARVRLGETSYYVTPFERAPDPEYDSQQIVLTTNNKGIWEKLEEDVHSVANEIAQSLEDVSFGSQPSARILDQSIDVKPGADLPQPPQSAVVITAPFDLAAFNFSRQHQSPEPETESDLPLQTRLKIQGEEIKKLKLSGRAKSDIAKDLLRQSIRAVANEVCDFEDGHALGMLLAGHLHQTLTSIQGLGRYLSINDPGYSCEALALEVSCAGGLDQCTDIEAKNKIEAFKRDLRNKQHVYAFAATPKETVQRISEVAARRSTVEVAALLSALTRGAKIDNVTELVLDSQRILHGIARKPLVVGFTHGLHSVDDKKRPARSPAAHAGWIIGPKFKLEESTWTWPWNKGFRYEHVPIQNNLSVAISVPSWWEHADVEVTTYWRSLKNKTKGQAKRHRHRIELPGTTAGVTDALLAQQLPEVSEARPYTVVHGKPAQILLIGQNLWRSTRVTLGNQIADEITVLPALAGLVARFDKITELPSADSKTPRNGVEVNVWTSMGKRLAGSATILPSTPKKDTLPKIAIKPPFFVKGQKLEAELTAGKLEKAAGLRLQVHPWKGNQGYGPPITLTDDVKYDEATKIYRVAKAIGAGIDDLKSTTIVRVSLVVTPETEGKLQTITSDNRGVFYPEAPKLAWSVEPKGTDSTLTLTTPVWTEVAFPAFDQKVGVQLQHEGDPDVIRVTLKTTTWKEKGEGVFELVSKLDIDWKDKDKKTLADGFKILPRLIDDNLRTSLPLTTQEPKPLEKK